jgi:hypothetical protein
MRLDATRSSAPIVNRPASPAPCRVRQALGSGAARYRGIRDAKQWIGRPKETSRRGVNAHAVFRPGRLCPRGM